jgi:hypothetical protein
MTDPQCRESFAMCAPSRTRKYPSIDLSVVYVHYRSSFLCNVVNRLNTLDIEVR